MKQRVAVLILAVCTGLAAAAGLLLPGFISAGQDRRLQSETDVYATDGPESISLHPVAQLEDSLSLLSNGYPVAYEKSEGKKLNAAGAHRAALNTVSFLSAHGITGIPSKCSGSHSETTLLAINSGKAKSAIVWLCSLHDTASGNALILIDDNSGKMLSFTFTSSGPILPGTLEEAESRMKMRAVQLSETCADYYGWKADPFKPTVFTRDKVEGTIPLRSSPAGTLSLPFELGDRICSFNAAAFLPQAAKLIKLN